MTDSSTLEILLDFESVARIRCLALKCKYNLANHPTAKYQAALCNLKNLEVDETGKCTSYTVDESRQG